MDAIIFARLYNVDPLEYSAELVTRDNSRDNKVDTWYMSCIVYELMAQNVFWDDQTVGHVQDGKSVDFGITLVPR